MGGESIDTHVEVPDAESSSGQPDTAVSVSVDLNVEQVSASPPSLSPSPPPAATLPSSPPDTTDDSSDSITLTPEPESPDTNAASSTFSNLRLSPQRRPSTPRSSPARNKKHRKTNPTTQQLSTAQPTPPTHQPDDSIVSLIDPIYLLPSPASPPHPNPITHPATGPRVAWDRVVVYRFPLTADASKVPGDSRSYYSVGLDYGAGEKREEWEMEEWEMRRGKERNKKGCPELSAEERREVWIGAQEQLKEDAEQKEARTRYRDEGLSEASSDSVMAATDTDERKESAQPASTSDSTVVDVTESTDSTEPPIAPHTHNLRKRQPPPSPALPANQQPARLPSPPPLLFSDVSDLTFLRSSRARVGCSCAVAAGDRQTKVCSAPWLQQSKRSTHRRKDDDDHTTTSPTEGNADDQHSSDYMAGHDAGEVVCECLRAGVGCNSNTCSCYSYCCRNPYERYLFNAGKVNAKRRKMLASIKEMRANGVKVVAAEGGPESAGNANGGKGKTGSAARRRGRKRAQSV